ncbi:hypothetical protein FIM08_01225 [SAR202 cluster bacterium AC-647-N09_OGT_505m]|nr:hypothetical protein [SAR202 cluster bacterium AC-647-N09_OGT_505m]
MRVIRAAFRFAIVVAISLMLLTGRGVLHLSPVEELAKSHLYSLVQWEMENFLDKWIYRAKLLLRGSSFNQQARVDLVLEYFNLGEQENKLERAIQEASKSPDGSHGKSLDALKKELLQVEKSLGKMRDMVEEVLEQEIDSIVSSEGLYVGGPLNFLRILFPPVDIRIEPSPRVLVVSPRDRIEMIDGILLEPGITLKEMEALEDRVFKEQNLSVLVEGTGGVATYPAVISPDFSLLGTLTTAAHEWLHHYLFFHPLGRTYGMSPDMTSLNETLATIFGQEIGNIALHKFEESIVTTDSPPQSPSPPKTAVEFDFRMEMRGTRIRVEELLREGKLEETERYLEERRLILANHGHVIRKLNQAYFAFHGTYGDNPASISPIFEQLSTLRAASPSLGYFVREVASVSSYTEFLELLESEG